MPAGGRQKAATQVDAVRHVEPYAAKRGRRARRALMNQRASFAALQHQIRRLGISVGLVGSIRICPAQVGLVVGRSAPDRTRRIARMINHLRPF
jgi:hypothetical protein